MLDNILFLCYITCSVMFMSCYICYITCNVMLRYITYYVLFLLCYITCYFMLRSIPGYVMVFI